MRRRKQVEKPHQDSDFSDDEEVSQSEDDENSSSETEEWRETPKKKPKMKRPKKDSAPQEHVPFISEYEKIRLQNIAERNEMLKSLGIDVNFEDDSAPSSSKRKPPKRVVKEKTVAPLRMSLRSKKVPLNNNDGLVDEVIDSSPDVDKRNLGCERWREDEMEGREQFLEELKGKINDINYDVGTMDLSSCSQDCFRDVMLSLVVLDTPRVCSTRIQSICVHPSQSKRIVFAGSISGSLGIWDVDGNQEDSYIELHPNGRHINCIAVDEFNPNQIYLTSHDGTFSMADITTRQFVNIYATPYNERVNHLTWHDQTDPNMFLIAHGGGDVLIMDKREKSVSERIECFDRSARTVQHHPSNSNYFLVSSGALGAGCSIFDLRSKKEIVNMDHPKGLTSAFFSHSGNKIISTCNDDTVKIWDSANINKVSRKVSVIHNNHTGQWLSVFKAQWYPGRDDLFYIGSLMSPRRIQMYTDEGKLLTELRSDEIMTTIQPVISVHKSLPFVVGGNSAGRLHAFVPPL